jgi:multicomponent Na+:H+ antiporter subunit G
MLQMAVALCLLVGVLIRLLASFGLLRFGDVYLRMHVSTTASTLGIGLILAAVVLHFGDPLLTIKVLALTAIYVFTAPIGAQVLAHGAHVARTPKVKETWIDELDQSPYTDIESLR